MFLDHDMQNRYDKWNKNKLELIDFIWFQGMNIFAMGKHASWHVQSSKTKALCLWKDNDKFFSHFL